jgi:K+-sensing histidine kinase KdpD
MTTDEQDRSAALDDRVNRDDRPTGEGMLPRARGRGPTEGGRGRRRLYRGIQAAVGTSSPMLEEGRPRIARATNVMVGYAKPNAGYRP